MRTYTIIKVRDGVETEFSGTADDLKKVFKNHATYNPIGKYLELLSDSEYLKEHGNSKKAAELIAKANKMIEELAQWGYVVPKV